MKFKVGDNVKVKAYLLRGLKGRIVNTHGKQGYSVSIYSENITDCLYFKEEELEIIDGK